MAEPAELAPGELESITDPVVLLARAWELESRARLFERAAVLDQLEALLESDLLPDEERRARRLQLIAERAIDAAANVRLDEGAALADQVLAEAHPDDRIATARAVLAKGRAIAWVGTDEATRQGDLILADAAERFRALEMHDWHGFTVFWRGYAIAYQNGDLHRACELMAQALEIVGADSPRRSVILDFYADALVDLGRLDAADVALDEATRLAQAGDQRARDYIAWSRAHVAAARGDAFTAERCLREAERGEEDWFQTHIGLAFLTDASQVLDRVGLTQQANEYLARAIERAGDDESIRQAQATLLARSGDPWAALEALQELVRGDWLEKRLIWRHSLLTAWATFRAGREGAGQLAARALDQAVSCGSLNVALVGEPDVVAALAPLAELAGSATARQLLLDGRQLIVRLLGAPSLVRADGTLVELPAGKPGELVRLLALHDQGLPVDMVLEAFFPDAPPAAGRQRLRQILTRLRTAAGEIVIRSDDVLRLVPAWVDVRDFTEAADRVRGASGARAVQLAYAALARWGGEPLPADRYASWAEEARHQLEYRHLALLDLVAADAAARGSHQEALTALDAAVARDPHDPDRYSAIAEQLLALGRNATAEYLAGRAGVSLKANGKLSDVGAAAPGSPPDPR